MGTNLKMLVIAAVVVVVGGAAWAASVIRLGRAVPPANTVYIGGVEKLLVQCGKSNPDGGTTSAKQVAYRLGKWQPLDGGIEFPAETTDELMDFSVTLDSYRIKVPPRYNAISFLAANGTDAFVCDVYQEQP